MAEGYYIHIVRMTRFQPLNILHEASGQPLDARLKPNVAERLPVGQKTTKYPFPLIRAAELTGDTSKACPVGGH
jgi:hypothetical protein